MKILIDTHYIIWLATNDNTLKNSELEILENPDNDIYFSSASTWEIAIKYNLGKLDIGNYTPKDIVRYLNDLDLEEIMIDSYITSSSYELPTKENHKDPFDRLLIWQAINNDLVILSRDEKFKQYIQDGLLLKQI